MVESEHLEAEVATVGGHDEEVLCFPRGIGDGDGGGDDDGPVTHVAEATGHRPGGVRVGVVDEGVPLLASPEDPALADPGVRQTEKMVA